MLFSGPGVRALRSPQAGLHARFQRALGGTIVGMVDKRDARMAVRYGLLARTRAFSGLAQRRLAVVMVGE